MVPEGSRGPGWWKAGAAVQVIEGNPRESTLVRNPSPYLRTCTDGVA